MFDSNLTRGKASAPLVGTYTADDGLHRLLVGTGLSVRRGSSGVLVVTAPQGQGAAAPTTEVGEIVVTGTRIRGGTTPSPLISIGAEQIREEGFTDLGEVIRSIPQNFGGGQNPGVISATVGGNIYNQNASGGSSLNLRGVGADATLTLLNGRRLAYGGFYQAVDIAAIPVEAVARIEVVPDGASALYGSDAVGGVGNVILRRDFEGLTLGARYGGATDGGLETVEFSATAGAVWTGGGIMATYKDGSTASIDSAERDYTRYMPTPFVIYPDSELTSGLVSVHQMIGDRVELRLDALRTERSQTWYQNYTSYYYANVNDTTTTLVAPSIEVSLPGRWSATLGGAWGKDEIISHSFMGTASSAQSLILHTCHCNEVLSYEVGAEGPLFALGGGYARLAVGAGYRTNDYENRSFLKNTAVGGDESSRFAYAELNLPFIGPNMNIPGVYRAALTAAVRAEDYDGFGGIATPKIGLIYDPNADITLKASWGKSFKAPMLSQRYSSRYVALWSTGLVGGTGYPAGSTVLESFGGNPDLEAERATSTAVTLAYHPQSIPNLTAELTWFDIDYTDRVVQPLPLYQEILSNPALAEFIDFSPTADELAQVLAAFPVAFYNYAGSAYDPSKVVAIAYGHVTNAVRQKINGVDLSGAYGLDLGEGRLTVRGSASWLDSSQQNSAAQSVFDLAGMMFYPAKLKGRAGVVWTEGGLTAATFVNYTDGVTVRATGYETGSFTTFDATLRYRTSAESGPLSGVEVALSAQNLFDRAPPLYTPTSTGDVPYDSTNYSAIGRFISLSVSKHF
ncbi:TonB-dependent receptor [Brevundimonas sp.]|uniref:TonB-dependent receptor n=1 Tax=Brevundimonas sp. TaxID=1871086 RepID=UPI001ACE6B29|nr:TonB-dependent receptor [Brevundimonas sp.]MBN9464802.1 TonB-dependent receptor [Brevundimonas sp.]